jgi:benzoyl-CoA reductase/2-hydroxyglutaryl-CoA dehydratase subunit BcrC/BadD/HgdB
MKTALQKLAADFGTNLRAAEKIRENLKPARELALKLDEMSWKDDKVKGWENHLWLVSASDFNCDEAKYRKELLKIIDECAARPAFPAGETRLGYIGVPSVYAKELYPYIEKHGARVVYNEVQRQFAMPEPGKSLAEQYTNYTYPYSLQERIKDIKTETNKRKIQGVIHYVQAFCHRGIADLVFRETLGLPVLTLEGNADFFLNGHVKTRIEAFLDMIQRKSNLKSQISKPQTKEQK